MKKIPVKAQFDSALKPVYSTEFSSGADLLSSNDQDISLQPGERKLIPTGLFLEIPTGYEAQVRPRSGFAIKHGITVLNTPGTIDSDYRGEVKVILVNLSKTEFVIKKGMRIAQIIFAPIVQAEFKETHSLSQTTRGAGGFGSTGH
ncbi:MAG: dUTP diphosphatase [Spirochaetia bacterium]